MTFNRRHRVQRIMSLAEARVVNPALLKQLRYQGVLPPIAGGSINAPGDVDPGGEGGGTPPPDADADSDDDGGDAADDESDDDGTDTAATGKKPVKRTSKRRSSSDDGDDDEDGYVRLPRSEMQRLRRESRDAKAALHKREQEERTRREKDMADQEKWKDLAESRDERITELEGEIEALKMEGTKNERRASVIKVAKRLSFEYPDDAHLFLDADDMEDERSIESALKTVLRERPRLKSRRRGSGAPIPGEGEDDGKGGGLTIEDVKKMSPEEINKRWTEVQAVLRSQETAAS